MTGLDAAQLAELGENLKSGGRPRVRLSGPQFPPDTVGTVLRIGDPAVDGEDYMTVRARVGGVVDELAFSPTELTRVSKAATKATEKEAPAPRPRRPAKAKAIPAPGPGCDHRPERRPDIGCGSGGQDPARTRGRQPGAE